MRKKNTLKKYLKPQERFKIIKGRLKALGFDGGMALAEDMPKHIVYNGIHMDSPSIDAWMHYVGDECRIALSYPIHTDQRTLRKIISRVDEIFKMFAYRPIFMQGKICAFEKIQIPYGTHTNMKVFYRKRDDWIRREHALQKREGYTNDEAYRNVMLKLQSNKSILQKRFGIWRPRKRSAGECPIKRDPFILSQLAIKNIVKAK